MKCTVNLLTTSYSVELDVDLAYVRNVYFDYTDVPLLLDFSLIVRYL
jgi:hypothetical protein